MSYHNQKGVTRRLVTATFLTLFVLPVLFAWFSKGKLSDMA
jgi:cobalt-zinc-cadmium resistance protein CzcA